MDAMQLGHYRSNKLCPMYEQTYGKAAKVPNPSCPPAYCSLVKQPADGNDSVLAGIECISSLLILLSFGLGQSWSSSKWGKVQFNRA